MVEQAAYAHFEIKKPYMKKLLTTTITGLLVLITLSIDAQNSLLSIQGVLRNANGTAVENGKYDITFRLYTEANSGNFLWEESIDGVDVEGGVYSVILGSAETPLNAAFDQPYYLGVSVEGGTELIPRTRLTSSPYALSLIGDDNVFPNSGNVGVGSDAPQSKLTIQRGTGVLGLEAIEDANNTSIISTTANGLEFDAGGVDKTHTFSNGDIKLENGNIEMENGDIKIGNGDIKLENGAFVFFDEVNTPNALASLDFDEVENNLSLKNETGAVNLNGTHISLKSDNDSVSIEGALSVFSESINGVGGSMKVNADSNLIISNHIAGGDLVIEANGGIVEVNNGLRVNGSLQYYLGGWINYGVNGETNGVHNGLYPADIYADNYRGKQFLVDSDQRIKKDLKISNAKEDLKILNQIEVNNYRHIDEVNLGTEFRKGLIAQQVAEVFPEAINLTKEFIPNIYCMSSKVVATENGYRITLPTPHQLGENDVVKIITETGDLNTSIERVDEYNFIINASENSIGDKVFVYGKEVDDFHNVDYDRIFTLNVSATQELVRRVEALEKEKIMIQKTKENLKSVVANLNTRMKKLESLLNATSSAE